MLERVLLSGNILDRIAELERRIAELEAVAVTVQVAGTPSGNYISAPQIRGTIPIGCYVYRSTQQLIPNATVTPLSWDAEVVDIGGCWSSAYPDRLVAPVAGYYMAGGGWTRSAAENPNASRHWAGILVYNSGGVLRGYYATSEVHTVANNPVGVSVTTGMFFLNPGDYVQVCVYQNSGAGRYAEAGSPTYPCYNYGWLVRIA